MHAKSKKKRLDADTIVSLLNDYRVDKISIIKRLIYDEKFMMMTND